MTHRYVDRFPTHSDAEQLGRLRLGWAGNRLSMANDDEARTELDEAQDVGRPVERRGTGISKWSLALLVLAIILAIILGQNTEQVTVEVLWTSFDAPLFLVVLLAALGLTVLWELATLALRHRRRRARRA